MDAGKLPKLRPASLAAAGPDRWLSLAGAILLPLGLLVVLLGWYGAASTGLVFEQVPYLISGGLLGLAMAVVGGLLFFGSWVARLVAETRRQSDLLERLLSERSDQDASRNGAAPSPARAAVVVPAALAHHDDTEQIAVALVATATGSMAHRPDCPVVVRRSNLRAVTARAGFDACKICATA